MSKLVLGLDIGIASVGVGIIDLESNEVVHANSLLFEEGTAAENVERRGFRSSRRLKRRCQQRIEDIKKVLIKEKVFSKDDTLLDNPYELRCKGLSQKLSGQELATALIHITKNRGLVDENIIPDDEKEIKENQINKTTISHNHKELVDKKMYICELQSERLKNGKVRGQENLFFTKDYLIEVDKILDNQNLSKEANKKIKEIISRKREYYEGPGSINSPTKYGRFIYNEKTGQIDTIDLIEKMRGKCSIYPTELRAAKMSYSAELFNLLNDLNNIKYDGDNEISKDDKLMVIDYVNNQGNITPKGLAKLLSIPLEKMEGFRINKKDEPILTEFKGYKLFIKCVKDNELNIKVLDNKPILDEIANILTGKKGINERIESINNIEGIDKDIFNDNVVKALASISGFVGYHSFSLKAINEIIPELINTNYNQMQIITLNHLQKNKEKYKGLKNIPKEVDDILSPVVKRSFTETIKAVNEARKKYGEFDSIVIEMPRDRNSDEEKKRIGQYQRKNEENNKAINEILNGKQANGNTRMKIALYLQQDGKSMYSGKEIDLNNLITEPDNYEVDHIIPISISLDDSTNNKCLVYRKENQDKKARTPYQYFRSGEINSSYEAFKARVLELYTNHKINRHKKDNLLFEKDINAFSIRKAFIERNLVDTRYASRSILNVLQNYFKENNINTTVYTIRGQITHQFRVKSNLKKDRDETYSHHAIDALIISGLKKMNLMNSMLKIAVTDDNIRSSYATGEVITPANESEYFDSKLLSFISSLNNVDVKYSHKVDRKYNRSISKQTIYGVRKKDDDEYYLGKYKLYEDGEKIALLFKNDKAKDKLLMASKDVKTYNKLKEIYEKYPGVANPFKEHLDQTGEVITKYSKNGKGPEIKEVKYYDSKLGNCLDVSHNYKGGKVVLLSLNPYRLDLYKVNETYRFIQIYQHELKYDGNKVYIDEEVYNTKLKENKISEDAQFVFSIYKNERLRITKDHITQDYLYSGVMNNSGLIYYKCVDKPKLIVDGKEIRTYISIKEAENIVKVNTDVLGEEFIDYGVGNIPNLIIKK